MTTASLPPRPNPPPVTGETPSSPSPLEVGRLKRARVFSRKGQSSLRPGVLEPNVVICTREGGSPCWSPAAVAGNEGSAKPAEPAAAPLPAPPLLRR